MLHLLDWYRELSIPERKTFWGCFGGWTLDALDLQLFSFLIPTLIMVWGITRADAGTLSTAALISSSVGGWVCGNLSDRYGRVLIMKATIIWFAVFTVLTGLTQSYDQMLVMRVFQGLGLGGEWAAGAVLMGEIIRPEHRGKAVGCVQSAYAVGWAAASVVATACLVLLPPDWGWRTSFFIGGIPALFVIFIRRNIREPEISERVRLDNIKRGSKPNFYDIFRPGILYRTVLTSLLALGLQGGGYIISIWLPTFLKMERHLSTIGTGASIAIITLGAFCGYIVSSYLSDAIGRRTVVVAYSVGAVLTVLLYINIPITLPLVGTLLGVPLGFFASGVYSVLGPFFSELFPTRIRASGQSFAYGFGRGLGALLVGTVGIMSRSMTLGAAIETVSFGCYAVAIVAAILLPETKGLSLTDVDGVVDAPVPEAHASVRRS